MQIITYCLRDKINQSDKYYKISAEFADEVLLQSESLTGPIIDDFHKFIVKTGREQVRSKPEYTLEFLAMGILYKIYSDDAIELLELPEYFLSNLYIMRQQCSCFKPGIDFLRGILGTIFLSPNDHMDLTFPDPSLENLKKLVEWMSATGEFIQEAKRLNAWIDFLSDKSEAEVCHVLATSITFALWFEARSEEVLGSFTQNVPKFLNERSTSHRWMEDFIFCRHRDSLKNHALEKKLVTKLNYKESNYVYDEDVRKRVKWFYSNMPDRKPGQEWYDSAIKIIGEM